MPPKIEQVTEADLTPAELAFLREAEQQAERERAQSLVAERLEQQREDQQEVRDTSSRAGVQ